MPDMPAQPAGDEAALAQLDSERIHPASRNIDRMSSLAIVRLMNAEDATVVDAVQRELPHIARAVEAIAQRLRQGGRLMYVGAGTSGRLGALDAAECPPTFNVARERIVACIAGGSFAWDTAVEDAEDRADLGTDEMEHLDVGPADAIVGITASGRTPYVLGAIAAAQARGALTIGIACNTATPLEQQVDILIAPVTGPEIIAGSTRLKAGTAQKLVLNMLSTGAMVLLGKTYGNLMVDVQATNAKLRARALAIVREATGVDSEEAGALLVASDGEVKTAIVAGLAHVSPDAARALLRDRGGIVRAALGAES